MPSTPALPRAAHHAIEASWCGWPRRKGCVSGAALPLAEMQKVEPVGNRRRFRGAVGRQLAVQQPQRVSAAGTCLGQCPARAAVAARERFLMMGKESRRCPPCAGASVWQGAAASCAQKGDPVAARRTRRTPIPPVSCRQSTDPQTGSPATERLTSRFPMLTASFAPKSVLRADRQKRSVMHSPVYSTAALRPLQCLPKRARAEMRPGQSFGVKANSIWLVIATLAGARRRADGLGGAGVLLRL